MEYSADTVIKKVKSSDAILNMASRLGIEIQALTCEDTEGYIFVAYTPSRSNCYEPEDYKMVQGSVMNVNNVFSAISRFKDIESYGPNSTVNYLALRFEGISTESGGFPVISVRPNDFMLMELTIPAMEWLNIHNLLNFTPYFFDFVDENGNHSNIFASIDKTVQFFKDIQPGTVHKICCTACNAIADNYAAQGYQICRIPVEYISNATFLPMIRVGIMRDHMSNLPVGMLKAVYYQSTYTTTTEGLSYSDTRQIIQTFERPMEPLSDSSTRAIHAGYNEAIKEFTNAGYVVFHTFNYLSHLAKVKYAFQSFYDAVSVRPVIEMLGNNTGENYFISDDIDITKYSITDTLYILSVNQALTQCALSSNVQIYNRSNNSNVPNGTFATSPELPPMSISTYPFSSSREVHSYPTMMISKYSLQNLLQNGIRKIAIAERNAYNPLNYSYTSTLYIDTACYFIGEDLPVALLDSLKLKYKCTVRHCYEPCSTIPTIPTTLGDSHCLDSSIQYNIVSDGLEDDITTTTTTTTLTSALAVATEADVAIVDHSIPYDETLILSP